MGSEPIARGGRALAATGDGAPHPLDQVLLGLEVDPDGSGGLSFVVQPHTSRTDGRFYGGAALAAALACSEAVTGRRALWSSTQLVASADLGERIRVEVDVVAAGRRVDQVQVRGLVGERLIFGAVGSNFTARPDGLEGTGQVMPDVPLAEECGPWQMPWPEGAPRPDGGGPPTIGHHLVSEYRAAPLPATGRPGHLAMWARLTGAPAATGYAPTPAGIAFLADMVPLVVSRACGVNGAGTSLDNSLRVGEPATEDWVLLELDAHVAVGSYGHGQVHVWSPDGRMLATGTQSARLFTLEAFAATLPQPG